MAKKKRYTIVIPEGMKSASEISLWDFDCIVKNSFKITEGDFNTGDLVVEGDLNVAENLNTLDLTVEGDLYVAGNLSANNLIVKGDLEVEGDMDVCMATVEGDLSAKTVKTDGNLVVKGIFGASTIKCNGDLTVEGVLEVDENLEIKGTLSVNGEHIMLEEDEKKHIMHGDVHCGGKFWTFGSTTVKGNLNSNTVTAVAELNVQGNLITNELHLLDNVFVKGDLLVNGDICDTRDFSGCDRKKLKQ